MKYSLFTVAGGCLGGGVLCYFLGELAIARGMEPNAAQLWQIVGPIFIVAAGVFVLVSVVFFTMGFVKLLSSRSS